jgi:hypothetical protein
MVPQPFVKILALAYPASEIYFFRPLNERVAVFQEPFTLLQEVVLEVSPEAAKALAGQTQLKLSGMLHYQACDDEPCFNCASVPLSWTLKLTPTSPNGSEHRANAHECQGTDLTIPNEALGHRNRNASRY